MIIIQLTLNLYGNMLAAKDLISTIKDPVKIVSSHEPTDINPALKQKYDFGHVAIQHPNRVGIQYQLEDYYEWYVGLIEKYYNFFKINGLAEIDIYIDVYYSTECNFEIFNNQLLKRLAVYDVALPFSAYNASNENLRILLDNTGYDSTEIKQLFRFE